MSAFQKATLVLMVLMLLNLCYISFMLSPGGGTRWPPVGSPEAVPGSVPTPEGAITIPNHLEYLACGVHYLVESEILRASREAEGDEAPEERQPPDDAQDPPQ